MQQDYKWDPNKNIQACILPTPLSDERLKDVPVSIFALGVDETDEAFLAGIVKGLEPLRKKKADPNLGVSVTRAMSGELMLGAPAPAENNDVKRVLLENYRGDETQRIETGPQSTPSP